MDLTWEKTMVIGIDAMDKEHKQLLVQASKLFDAIRTDQYKEAIFETIQVLMDYTVHHFTSEEGLMKRWEYPDYQDHKNMHIDFIDKLNHMIDELNRNEFSLQKAIAFNKLVTDWIVYHIGEEDMKYANYINNKGRENES